MTTIDAKTKDRMSYYEKAFPYRKQILYSRHDDIYPLKITFNASLLIINTVAEPSIPDLVIGIVQDDGNITPIIEGSSYIKEDKIADTVKQDWSTASYNTIGHTDGYPNIGLNSIIIHMPDDLNKKDATEVIKNYLPAGKSIFVKTYER